MSYDYKFLTTQQAKLLDDYEPWTKKVRLSEILDQALDNTPVGAEVDPIFNSWLAGHPNISIFTNDAGYISSISGVFTLDQTTPQTVTGGAPIFSEGLVLGGITPLTHVEGRIYYDSVWKTVSADINNDITLQIGQEELRLVYNNTGSTIHNGEIVYTNGVYTAGANDVVTVALAKADSPVTAFALGCATQDIPNLSYGFVCVRGNINGLDTNEIGRAFLTTQGLFFSARVGGVAGNTYSVRFIDGGTGGLSYTDVAGVVIIDLGGTTPQTTDIVNLFTASPSVYIKVKANSVNAVTVASVQVLANGVAVAEGDVLYLSAVDAGFLTTVAPLSPNLRIRMGRLITKDSMNGRINIRILSTSRVEDLSDIEISSSTDGDIVVYDASTTSWKNQQFRKYAGMTQVPTFSDHGDGSAVIGAAIARLYSNAVGEPEGDDKRRRALE